MALTNGGSSKKHKPSSSVLTNGSSSSSKKHRPSSSTVTNGSLNGFGGGVRGVLSDEEPNAQLEMEMEAAAHAQNHDGDVDMAD